jgi:DNA-binding beta-propeller fold protein YncE
VVQVDFPEWRDIDGDAFLFYDEDGDTLVDLRVSWSDAAGPVDLGSARVWSVEGALGVVPDTANLLDVWDVERLDDTSLVVHEGVHYPLSQGVSRLVVAIADTAGNVATDTIRLELPYGAFHRTIPTGIGGPFPADGLAFCEGRVFMAIERPPVITVFDPESVALAAITPEAGVPVTELDELLCVPGDSVLYVSGSHVFRLNLGRLEWLPPFDVPAVLDGLTWTPARPDTLLAGEAGGGQLSVLSRSTVTRVGVIPDFWVSGEYVSGLAALADGSKVYATRGVDTGIWVLDPSDGTVLDTISVGGATWPDQGHTAALALSPDESRLYAAVIDGDPRGVVEIETRTDQVLRAFDAWPGAGIDLAVSPDGTRLFLTTQDIWPNLSTHNWLIDLSTPEFSVLGRFRRRHPEGVTRFDRDVVFHPRGHLVFVARDRDLDVYLNRK